MKKEDEEVNKLQHIPLQKWDWVVNGKTLKWDSNEYKYLDHIYSLLINKSGVLEQMESLMNNNELRIAPNGEMRHVGGWTQFKGGSRKNPKRTIPEYDHIRFHNGQGQPRKES
jgi:hypothetical protein